MTLDSRLVWPITIDDDVPIPARRGWRGAPTLDLPFDELRPPRLHAESGEVIRDSFFVPGARGSTVASLASNASKASPAKVFATRTLDEDPKFHIPGVRVWRIR